ncbi:NAD(P)/FAD-dependent oxidoreductase, partial [Flavobacterium sp.]|uniref:NAD(P)/FAD-dependent oxidoreductase n=1 Tax=Flavobacterium sp. TaxID=239 RepID=UPI002EDB3436
EAIFYNAYGITPGKLGSELLNESTQDLATTYPHITQIPNEKVIKVEGNYPEFTVVTNKNSYKTKNIVVGIGSANTFDIEGLMQFVEPHKKALPEKQRIQLKNEDHKVADGIYVIGTLAGWRSQLAIAAGSGAAVATDILTLWNNGTQTHAHDSIR